MFRLGIMLIPFENFWFAPSKGWAAIAPLVFFAYCLLNFNSFFKALNKTKNIIITYIMFFVLSGVGYIFYGYNVKNIIGNIFTLTLGLTFYCSLIIRYQIKEKDLIKDVNLLFKSYFLSFLVGMLQYIFYSLNNKSFITLVAKLSKRPYYPRVQFTFTEVSFISIHLYGILLIFILFFLENKIKIKKINYVIFIVYVIFANIFSKSARLSLDTIVIILLLSFHFFIVKRKKIVKFIATVNLVLLFFIFYNIKIDFRERLGKFSPRISKVLELGVYSDPSIASRFFRINASIKGYANNPKAILLGYGMGNVYKPFELGYEEAREEYKNWYMKEVIALKNSKVSTLFSMPIKIISEYGLILFITLSISLFSKRYYHIYAVLFYLYSQFDSYALYSIWIYIYFKKTKLNYIKSTGGSVIE